MRAPEIADSFARCTQFREGYPGRYHTHAFGALRSLRLAEGYRPRFPSVPDQTKVAVAGRSTYEGQVSVVPETLIWGLAGASEQPEGFKVQIFDAGTGERFFAAPMQFSNAGDSISSPLFVLPSKRVVFEPGLLNVQVINLSATTNVIQLVLFTAEPPAASSNAYNRALKQEAAAARRVKFAGLPLTSAPGAPAIAADPPWLVMPPNGVPFHQADSADTPAAGTANFTVLSFRIPDGWDAAIRALTNVYTGPGFAEGSGDLIWRISIDGVFQKGYDNITTTLGSVQDPRRIEGSIRAFSGQTVSYLVSVASGTALPTGAGTRIISAMDGWYYPKQ